MEGEANLPPKKDNMKIFIIIGCEANNDDNAIVYSNALFISRLACRVLQLPKESVKIFAPGKFMASGGMFQLRFRKSTYISKIDTNDIDFIKIKDKNDITDQIEKQINTDTQAYFFFMDHGGIQSFGDCSINFKTEELHTFLASINCQSKRVYVHACFSGTLVDFENICHEINQSDVEALYQCHELRLLWEKYCELSCSDQPHQVYPHNFIETLNTLSQISIPELIKYISLFPKEYIFDCLQKLHEIFSILKAKNFKPRAYKRVKDDAIRALYSNNGSMDELGQNSSGLIKQFITTAIEIGVTNPDQAIHLLELHKLIMCNTEIDYLNFSYLLSAASRIEKISTEFLSEVGIQYQKLNLLLRRLEEKCDYSGYVYYQFLKFLKHNKVDEVKKLIHLKNTKILTSSQSNSTSCNYSDHLAKKLRNRMPNDFQNDPVTCEYIYQLFTSRLHAGIDFQSVVETVMLMKITATRTDGKDTFQVPQLFQTDFVSDDSLQMILEENGINTNFYGMIELCGYIGCCHKTLETLALPPIIMTVTKKEKHQVPNKITTYMNTGDSCKVTETAFDEQYSIVGYIKPDWIIPEGVKYVHYRQSESITWNNLPIASITSQGTIPTGVPPQIAAHPQAAQDDGADPLPRRITGSFSSSSIGSSLSRERNPSIYDSSSSFIEEEEEEEEENYKEEPLEDEQLPPPPPEGDIFDTRYLKVAPNLRCGLQHFNLFDMDRNRKWAKMYNTLRLFSYHLKEEGIKFDPFVNPNPKKYDPYFLCGDAFECCEKREKCLSSCYGEYNQMIAGCLNQFFLENKDKYEKIEEIYTRSLEEARAFVKNNFWKTFYPLITYSRMCLCNYAPPLTKKILSLKAQD